VQKATLRGRPEPVSSTSVGDDVAARAAELRAALIGVIESNHELAARYERLVASADLLREHLRAVEDALLEVRERLGSGVVVLALEAPARRARDRFAAGGGGLEAGARNPAGAACAGRSRRPRAAGADPLGREP
jgi:hypothetical protein